MSLAMLPRRATLALVLTASPAALAAQVLASERGVVAQTVDGTTITVEYYRPSARGRELFGKTVHWGETWTPGANWATTLEVSKDAMLEGRPLPKGKYSLWMVPRQDSAWTLIVSTKARVYHTMPPRTTADDQLRLAVRPTPGPMVEVLTWSFPSVRPDGATLHLQWGTTDVPLRIGVEPTRPAALGPSERATYTGTWDVTFDAEEGRPPMRYRMTVADTPRGLRGTLAPSEPGADPTFDLLPAGPNRFHPGMHQNGTFIGVELDWTFVFAIENGRAARLVMLGADDKPIGSGRRADK